MAQTVDIGTVLVDEGHAVTGVFIGRERCGNQSEDSIRKAEEARADAHATWRFWLPRGRRGSRNWTAANAPASIIFGNSQRSQPLIPWPNRAEQF